MASNVRAGGRKVACRLEALEASTARNSSSAGQLPSTGTARTPKTLSEVSSLPSPRPSVPTPAYIIAATATSRYVARMVSTVTIAARPGVVAEPSLSSLTVRQTSQPQTRRSSRPHRR